MSTPQERAAAARALVDAEPAGDQFPKASVVGWLHRLSRAVVRALPAAGAGISVLTDQGVGAVAASCDPASLALEELQFSLGEGPCFDAFAARGPVLEPDLGQAQARWPAYAPAARGLGARAVFAFPLQVGASRLGVLDVYRAQPGSLSQQALGQALTFAEVAVDHLLDAQATSGAGAPHQAVDGFLEGHHEVFQAQGMVMVDLAVSLSDAMARLRAYAFTHDLSLRAVAAEIVAGRLALEPDRP